jgi:uncharacterized membrane-anchored protein
MEDPNLATAPVPRPRGIARFAGHIRVLFVAAILVTIGFVANAQQQSQEELWKKMTSLAWQAYPTVGVVGSEAKIQLTNDLHFLDAPNTNRFVQLNGNLPVSNAYTIAPRLLDCLRYLNSILSVM